MLLPIVVISQALAGTIQVNLFHVIDPQPNPEIWNYTVFDAQGNETEYTDFGIEIPTDENSWQVQFPPFLSAGTQFSFVDEYYFDGFGWVHSATYTNTSVLISYIGKYRYDVYYIGSEGSETFEVYNPVTTYGNNSVGSVLQFRWNASAGVTGPDGNAAQLTIKIRRDGGEWETIASGIPYNNNPVEYDYTYDWTVTEPIANSCDTRYELTDYAGNFATDERLNNFSITPNTTDTDGDGVYDSDDNCISIPNPGQEDFDGDGIGDVCDPCTDTDGDGFGNPGFSANTCPPDQCEGYDDNIDTDEDGIPDGCDNCPSVANPDQMDCNANGIGDVCESSSGCSDPTNWTATYGGVDVDEAVFVEPLYDTTWTSEVTSVATTIDQGPKSRTIPVNQTIHYNLTYGTDDYPCYAQIKLNDVVMDRIDNDGSHNNDIDNTVSGTFEASSGDVVTVEVVDLSQSSGKEVIRSKATVAYTTAQFEYETPVAEIAFNSYLFVGTKTNETKDFFIARTDECGAIIDSISIGTDADDIAKGACLAAAGHVVVAGYSQTDNDISMYVVRCRIDDNGTFALRWDKTLNYSEDDRAQSILDAGSSYFILGTTKVGDYDNITLINVDSFSNFHWQKTYTTGTDDLAGEIIRGDLAGTYYIVGTVGGPHQADYDVRLLKVDGYGNVLEKGTFGEPGYYEIGRTIALTDNNDIIIGGQSNRNGTSDMLLMKINQWGHLVWSKFIGGDGYENCYDLLVNGSDGYILVGRTSPPPPSYWDCYYVMTDPDGNVVYENTYGEANDDVAFSINPTFDNNGYIMAGYSVGNCSYDCYLKKFTSNYPAAPELVSPISGELFYDVEPPYLNWNDVSGADAYTVQIDNDPDFSSPRLEESGITTSGFQIPYMSLKEATYYWRVRGYNSTAGHGFWSSSGTFNIKYGKPVLTSPQDGATVVTHKTTRFTWDKLEGTTEGYNIQIAADKAFTNLVVDETTNNCPDGYCSYSTAFSSSGTYFWRVRLMRYNFYWSDVRKVVVEDIAPSCPVLYSFNGEDFVQENPLLTACEESGYTDIVTDYYQVTSTVVPQGDNVIFQLREMEDEITYLNDVELITVDHSTETKVGCSVDGHIFTYLSSVSPISAVDQNGVDWAAVLSERDDEVFSSEGAGSLVLTFPNKGGESGISLSAPAKGDCTSSDPTSDKSSGTTPEVEKKRLTVEQLADNGEWVTLPAVPTRVNATAEFIMGSQITTESDVITFRISWEDGFTADEIRQYVPSDETPEVETWKIATHRLSSENASAKVWSGFTGTKPLILKKGDIFEFSFAVDKTIEKGMTRDYIIKATGRYQPDYSVYSHLTPDDFHLFDNYPNPFNPTTTISYNLPAKTHVKLVIFNILGQEVATLVDEVQDAGYHQIEWDSKDNNGNTVSSGIFFYKLITEDYVNSKKMILLK